MAWMFEYDVSLNHNHGDISIAMKTLKGQRILIDDELECIKSAPIVVIHYGNPDGWENDGSH